MCPMLQGVAQAQEWATPKSASDRNSQSCFPDAPSLGATGGGRCFGRFLAPMWSQLRIDFGSMWGGDGLNQRLFDSAS